MEHWGTFVCPSVCSLGPDVRPEEANWRPEKADLRLERVELRLNRSWRTDLKPEH